MNEEAERLAEEHWRYVEVLLRTHGEKEEYVKLCGFHYQTAFVHGFKHGVEWSKEDDRKRQASITNCTAIAG